MNNLPSAQHNGQPELAFLETQKFRNATEGDLKHSRIQYERGIEYYRKRIDVLEMKDFGDVLDAACGCGQWTLALSDVNGFIRALDINAGLLEIAQCFTREYKKKNIQYYQGDLHFLPFKDATFDAIFSYSALMYTNEDKVIKEFSRVLKPGGKIYVCSDGPGWPLYKVFIQGLKQGRLRSILGAFRLTIRTFSFVILLKRHIKKITFLRRKDVERLFKQNNLEITFYGPDGSFGNMKSQHFKPLYGETFFGLPADFEVIGFKRND